MFRSALCAASAAATLFLPAFSAFAAGEPLTLQRALALARERAPALVASRLQIEEARGRRAGAAPLFPDNPVVVGALGRRLPGGATAGATLEGRVELIQVVPVGGGRGARLDAASAAVDAQSATSESVLRESEAAVARAFFRGVHARERRRLALAAEEVAASSAAALERRFRAGDVPALEANLARTARARTAAEVRSAQALEHAAKGELVALLGLDPAATFELAGELREQKRYDLDQLLARARQRPDVRSLEAQAREARAEEAAGRSERWPRLGVGAAYEREGHDDIVLGILSFTLPVFQRGQGLRATAAARAQRLALEADAGRRSAAAAVRAAHLVHQERAAAARLLEEALPLVSDSEELSRKSYEAGQLPLAGWLIVRREALETRIEHADRLLEAAEAGVNLALSAGVSP